MLRIPIITLFAVLTFGSCLAQSDSVVISGRVANLTARLYRQAPSIIFSRNNILQPQTELSRQAPLQADGSFRISLPLIFQNEEIYMNYGGTIFTTFLAAKGNIEINFDADSLFKSKKPFKFSGVYADANNLYPDFLEEDRRFMESNKKYGSNFWDYFPTQTLPNAATDLQNRSSYRSAALGAINQGRGIPPMLRYWVESIITDESRTFLTEYALANDAFYESNMTLTDSITRFLRAPLTVQKVTWASRFAGYAERLIQQQAEQGKNINPPLSASFYSEQIIKYVKPLSGAERNALDELVAKDPLQRQDLEFLNSLYKRNKSTLDLISNYERKRVVYRRYFNNSTVEFLSAWSLANRFYSLNLTEQKIAFEYLSRQIQRPAIRKSLKELYEMEIADSLNIAIVQQRNDLTVDPKEVLSGIWLSESNGNGKAWMDRIQQLYAGKAIYLIKWSVEDEMSRNELAYLPALRAQLSDDVVFLFVHIPQENTIINPELWKQYIVRHRLNGVHMFLNETQLLHLYTRLSPFSVPSFALIKPNGRFLTKNAQPPGKGENTYKQILNALKP